MSRPALLKLGGSILTDKSREQSFRRSVARRLMVEIAKSGVPVVLCHGAGSFGHPQAKAAGLTRGPTGVPNLDGVAKTLASVALLHAHVLDVAAEAGLKPLSIPVHAMADAVDGVVESFPVEAVQEALAAGMTPVLAGTAIPDSKRGWTVLSADQIMAVLAAEINPRLALFASNVDGVLDGGGELIPEIRRGDAIASLGGATDVTGSMEAKVAAALEVAESCSTIILNGNERGRLLDALRGKAVLGTRPLP